MEASLPSKIAAAIALAMAGLTSASSIVADAPTVPSIELDRYVGTWYEQARLPNRFQRDCVRDVSASYALNDDGSINVTNRCVRADGSEETAKGLATVPDLSQPGQLAVTFMPKGLRWLPFTQAQYRVVALDPDYRWSIVGGEDRKYLWLLTREPAIDSVQRGLLLDKARELGYDTAQLQFSSH
ncbi:apolipoprotein D and lipocalin family protein [Tahibacter aquaticus]|uniref:Outer membrane lipoprotein Blc n=1 Tax=Tahibacter aquaticus TaxID=520092 RepID=A0A4R6YQ94_9GAMM|nr:lipocalin family protein [Tahibacter aquaticus]TDR40081.1 apolipoprotein D and lipocalin family protein [Tahibacter aquaticus]